MSKVLPTSKALPKTPLFFFLLLAGSLLFPSAAVARDSDRDGLSDRREKKLGTNPFRADTDRDGLRDGREVKRTRTNPLRADTDRDGLRDGREIRLGSSPLKRDTDADGIWDRSERRGRVVGISGSLVRVRDRSGARHLLQTNADTFFAGPDSNGDGHLSLADFAGAKRVVVSWDSSGRIARALRAEGARRGTISSLSGEGFQLSGQNILLSPDTQIRGTDRNQNGLRDTPDLLEGDVVWVFVGANGTALSVERRSARNPGLGGRDSNEAWGRVVSVGAREIVLARRGEEKKYRLDGATRFFGPEADRHLSSIYSPGGSDWSDVAVGSVARLFIDGGLVSEVLWGASALPLGGSTVQLLGTLSADRTTLRTLSGSVPISFSGRTEFFVADRNLDRLTDESDLLADDRLLVVFRAGSSEVLSVRLMRGLPLAEEVTFSAEVFPPAEGAPAASITLLTLLGIIPFPIDSATIFEGQDRNLDGRVDATDFRPGDDVSVVFDTRTPRIRKLSLR